MKEKNNLWNPHLKALGNEKENSATRISRAVKHCEIRKQVIEYKLFCMEHRLHKNNLNSLALFCKQNRCINGENL